MKFEMGPTGKNGRSAWPLARRLRGRITYPHNSDCWIWSGAKGASGHGIIRIKNRNHSVYRVVYEIAHGAIGDGLVLDHLCKNPACVNPAHLEPVTQRVNLLRGSSPCAINAQKTHCPSWHQYTPENTYTAPNRSRQCRTCRRRNQRNSHRRGK